MRRRLAAGALALAGLALIVYATVARKTDEELIRERLAALSTAVRLDEPQGNALFRKAHLNEAFQEIFTGTVSYRIPELSGGGTGIDGLSSLAVRACGGLGTLEIEFTDVSIALEASHEAATARTRAVLRATRGSQPERDERNIGFDFTKDGDWRIAGFQVSRKAEREEE